MAEIAAAELHHLHELIWMEASMYEKFRHYRRTAEAEHVRELCDQLADRSRQHLTALARLLEPERTGVH